MIARLDFSVRSATPQDRQKLATLVHFETYVHRHLDWRPPLDWLGFHPYLVFEQKNEIVAALACPPDPPEVAWVRLFAVSGRIPARRAWQALWRQAKEELAGQPEVTRAAAIPLQHWFQGLLEESGFSKIHRVVVLSCDVDQIEIQNKDHEMAIRPMNYDDLKNVEVIDAASFGTVWQNSEDSLELAFQQAAVATVAEVDGHLVGYQISTATPMGGHLARLAVHPEYQGRGIGYSLVRDMLVQFQRRGAVNVTVNTQADNTVSMGLYEKCGFYRTGEEYPVYQFHM